MIDEKQDGMLISTNPATNGGTHDGSGVNQDLQEGLDFVKQFIDLVCEGSPDAVVSSSAPSDDAIAALADAGMSPEDIAKMLQESSMDTSAGSGDEWTVVCHRIIKVYRAVTDWNHADAEGKKQMESELGQEISKEIQNFVNDLFEGATFGTSAVAAGAALGATILAF